MAWSVNARAFVDEYSASAFFVEFRTPEKVDPQTREIIPGRIGIGTAFNIGCGYFATARHVVEGNTILRLGRNASRYQAFETAHIENIYYHESAAVDVAILKIAQTDLHPVLQLDANADIYDEHVFLLAEVVVMGYPPIPCADAAPLVALQCEVSAVINSRIDRKRNFVISGMARGGFSGGPVTTVANPNRVLGIVGSALIDGSDKTEELGFLAATSASSIFETAAQNHLNIREINMSLRGFVAPS
jgi:hypothetical protein